MKKSLQKVMAVACCGVVLGSGMSVLSAAPAQGRIFASCDVSLSELEQQLALQFQKGDLNRKDFDKALKQLIKTRKDWAC